LYRYIEYDRQNLGIEISVDKNENPVIVDMGVRVGYDDDDLTQEESDAVGGGCTQVETQLAHSLKPFYLSGETVLPIE
jgi:hypothetical protein